MRGVGKSTVGELVAERFNSSFNDLDDLALIHLGASSVCDVFKQRGEAVWRNAESAALKKYFEVSAQGLPRVHSQTQGLPVLSVGGGAPSNPSCRQLLIDSRAAGWRTVLLTAPIDLLVQRLTADMGDRAHLTERSLAEELSQLSCERAEFYSTLADAEVDGSADPSTVCDAVVALAFA